MKGLSRIAKQEVKETQEHQTCFKEESNLETFHLCIELLTEKVNHTSNSRILSLPTSFFEEALPVVVGPTVGGQDFCLHWRLALITEEAAQQQKEIKLECGERYGQGSITIQNMDNLSNNFSKQLFIGSIPVSVDKVDEDEHKSMDERTDDYRSNSVPFICGKTEISSGVIRLLREVPSSAPLISNTEERMNIQRKENSLSVVYKFLDLSVVLLLAVPAALSPSDLLLFIGSEFVESIEKVKLVRDAAPNRYMAILKFISHENAFKFISSHGGKNYSPMEPETCHAVLVSTIEFTTKAPILEPLFDEGEFLDANVDVNEGWQGRTLVEIPTCPVCLEKIDCTATGVVIVFCNHKFHCQCLARWGDGRCPVCRFALPTGKGKMRGGCGECDRTDNIWLCLICGVPGCGRYDEGHAKNHYMKTGHNFAMDVETHRVWDYSGDNYVHRLIRDEGGILVELPRPNQSPIKGCAKEKDREYDPEYYTSAIVAQLESQRIFYEQRLDTMQVSFIERIDNLTKDHERQISMMQKDLCRHREQQQEMARLHDLERNILEERIKRLSIDNQSLNRNLKDEKAMSIQASAMAEEYMSIVKGQIIDIEELKEQIMDLMAHFDGESRIDDNLRNGSIGLVPPPPPPSQDSPKRMYRRKKH